MLTAIEGKMEELFEELESLPPGKVEAAEKVNYTQNMLWLIVCT